MNAATQVVRHKLSAHTPLPLEAWTAVETFLGPSRGYAAGETIAAAGSPSDLITFLGSGLLSRSTQTTDGRRQITGLLYPGDAADLEAALFERRTDSIEALSSASVWLVPKSRLAGLVRTSPSLAEALMREAALSAEVARAWIANIGGRQALQRIAHFLCEACARMDAAGIGDGRIYPFPLRQEEIAFAQGLSAVHINRILQQLRALRLIELRSRQLRVLDRAGLVRVAGFEPGYLRIPNSIRSPRRAVTPAPG